MDNKLYDQFLIMQDFSDSNKQVNDELKQDNGEQNKKMNNRVSDFDKIKTLLKQVLVHNKNHL